ncbi:hypothetical protein ACH5RR_023156 [Cinchona calisaya]|uniref:Uncharacterized protein n=1 Tax=Cinchona calisaya TaxID=153742 RepID=A0ABD2Z9V4_9GENT
MENQQWVPKKIAVVQQVPQRSVQIIENHFGLLASETELVPAYYELQKCIINPTELEPMEISVYLLVSLHAMPRHDHFHKIRARRGKKRILEYTVADTLFDTDGVLWAIVAREELFSSLWLFLSSLHKFEDSQQALPPKVSK